MNRITYIDYMKGIGIFLVILAHMYELPNVLRIYIYSFHMPLFFFISGYLYKRMNNVTFFTFLKKKSKSLLYPFVTFGIILFLFNLTLSIVSSTPLNFQEYATAILYGNKIYEINYLSTLWFVLCLFVTELIFYLLIYLSKSKNINLVTLLVISSIIGYFYGLTGFVRLPFTLDIAFTAVVFYGLGYLYKNSTSVNLVFNKINAFTGTFLFGILSVVFSYLNYIYSSSLLLKDGRIDLLYLKYGNYFLFYAGAVTGILFIYFLSSTLQNRELPLLRFFGVNSLLIMIFHLPINNIISIPLQYLPIYEDDLYTLLYRIGLILLINGIVVVIINRWFTYLIKPISKTKTPSFY